MPLYRKGTLFAGALFAGVLFGASVQEEAVLPSGSDGKTRERVEGELAHYEQVVSQYWKGRVPEERQIPEKQVEVQPLALEAVKQVVPLAYVQIQGEQAKQLVKPTKRVVSVEDEMAIVLMMMMEMSK